MSDQKQQGDSLDLLGDPLPLWRDEAGAIRVRNTRILLDIIVDCYKSGMDVVYQAQWHTG